MNCGRCKKPVPYLYTWTSKNPNVSLSVCLDCDCIMRDVMIQELAYAGANKQADYTVAVDASGRQANERKREAE